MMDIRHVHILCILHETSIHTSAFHVYFKMVALMMLPAVYVIAEVMINIRPTHTLTVRNGQ